MIFLVITGTIMGLIVLPMMLGVHLGRKEEAERERHHR